MAISVESVARWTALVLTLVAAGICLLVSLAIGIAGLGAGQYYEAIGAGLMFALVGGLPPLLVAVVLGGNARLLKQGAASRRAKGLALVAALMMVICAVMTLNNRLGDAFVALFFLTAILLASPLALRTSGAVKPPKS